jgi:hypothetical protein
MSNSDAAVVLFDVMTRKGLFMRTYGLDIEVGPTQRIDPTLRGMIEKCKPELWSASRQAELLIEKVRRPRLPPPVK